MIKKKVCLIGGFAVGKTSLVQRYVSGLFSDDYLTTVGVKIDQRSETLADKEVRMMIWDLAGRDQFANVTKSYLRGADGFLFVADGTRRETLTAITEELAEVRPDFPHTPSLLLLNKCDLNPDWEVSQQDLQPFQAQGMNILRTSAKTGENVENAFRSLASSMTRLPAS
ncbi:MAG: Rab family GTPase [Verrucomicrobiota bacterium]